MAYYEKLGNGAFTYYSPRADGSAVVSKSRYACLFDENWGKRNHASFALQNLMHPAADAAFQAGAQKLILLPSMAAFLYGR